MPLSLNATEILELIILNHLSLENLINSRNDDHRNPWQEKSPLALSSTTTEHTEMEREVICIPVNKCYILISNSSSSNF